MSRAVPKQVNLVNALLRGTGINLVGLVFRFTFVFVQTYLAVRLFGAEPFGIYIVAISAVNLLSYIGQLGFSGTVVRYVALYIERKQWSNIARFLRIMLILTTIWSVVLGLMLNFASGFVTSLFSEVNLTNLFLVIGLAIPCLTLATLLAAFTQAFGVMQYKVLTLDVLAPVLEVVLLVLFWKMGFLDRGLVLSYTSSLIVVCMVLIVVCLRFLRQARRNAAEDPADEAMDLRAILRFSLYAWLSLLLRHATRPVNVFVIGALGTATMVGVYSVLERLVAVGVIFLMSINSMLAPMITRLIERGDYAQVGRMYVLAARWSLAICLPIFVVLAILGDRILGLFGPEFVDGSSALWLLAATWIFSLMTGPADVILMMSGRSHYSAFNQVGMICLMVGLGWWLIPMWGLIGAVAGFAIASIIVNILRVVQVQVHLKINPFGWSTTKVLFAGILMLVFSVKALNALAAEDMNSGWFGAFVVAFIGLVIYLLILIAVRLEQEEIHALQTVRKKLQLKYT